MTREEAKRRAELYSALAEGKTIQVQNPNGGEWFDVKIDTLRSISEGLNYRIKPEPKFRPFESQEECWNEMMKHHPFGWVKAPDGKFFCIDMVHYEGIVYKYSKCRFDEYFEGNYTFVDGSPFGIKEE